VPVYVLPATAADTAAETIDRIVINDHKSDLTDAQRSRGIQQMIDAGLPVSKAAKNVGVSRATVHRVLAEADEADRNQGQADS
jgi:ParB family chromosome partitioning protein